MAGLSALLHEFICFCYNLVCCVLCYLSLASGLDHEHMSALHSTSRFGFTGVANALNLELSPPRLFEVALVVAS
jgi:hypothetical protein